MLLEKFPQIQTITDKISEKAYKDPYCSYEISLIKQAGFLLGTKMSFKITEYTLHEGYVDFSEASNLMIVGVHKDLEKEKRKFVICHEVGHLIIAHYNLLHIKDEDFTFRSRGKTILFKDARWAFLMNRLMNPETEKEFSYRWYRKWNKKSPIIESEFVTRYSAVEKLCDEISEFFGKKFIEFETQVKSKQLLLSL